MRVIRVRKGLTQSQSVQQLAVTNIAIIQSVTRNGPPSSLGSRPSAKCLFVGTAGNIAVRQMIVIVDSVLIMVNATC